jgi:regulator-associated protein of mTOR
VLLSQSHRLRALVLLGRFLDMGAWAVDLALSVGIFPYVLKLLQTTSSDLQQILVFIWTKILALDRSCQADLVKDGGHLYFIRFVASSEAPPEERAMAMFVLGCIVDGLPKGQMVCAASGLTMVCLKQMREAASSPGSPILLTWLCLCLGKFWEGNLCAQAEALHCRAPDMLACLVRDPLDARSGPPQP